MRKDGNKEGNLRKKIMVSNQTAIDLSDDELELFKWFRKHQSVWEKAQRELRPGRLAINFDSSGEFDDDKVEFYCRGIDKHS